MAAEGPLLGPGAVGWLVGGVALGAVVGAVARQLLRSGDGKASGEEAEAEKGEAGGGLAEAADQVLTREEIRMICREFAISKKRMNDEAVRGELQHWFCPICLHANGRGRLLELPCFHRVHEKCARNAFEINLTTCAVCGWDAKTLFNKAPPPALSFEKPKNNRGMQTPRVKGSSIDVYETFSDSSSSDGS